MKKFEIIELNKMSKNQLKKSKISMLSDTKSKCYLPLLTKDR